MNLKDTSYVLNAGKDLEATQERFQDFLQRQETWKGIIGEEPKKEFLKQALTQNECYLLEDSSCRKILTLTIDILDMEQEKSILMRMN